VAILTPLQGPSAGMIAQQESLADRVERQPAEARTTMRSSPLPFRAHIGEEEIAEGCRQLKNRLDHNGAEVQTVRSDLHGSSSAGPRLAVFSATDAMQVALAALGVGPGDELSTTAMTFCRRCMS